MRGPRSRPAGMAWLLFAAIFVTGLAGAATAKSPPAPTRATRTIVENAESSKDHKTLVTLLKASGLVETLSGPGPFTVFAPTDEAFRKLPEGAVDNLMKSENKAQLQTVLTYHVVSGMLAAKDLVDRIREGGGKAQLKTVQGEALTVEIKGRSIELTDAKGGTAIVTVPNVMQSNGVVHVVNAVLLP